MVSKYFLAFVFAFSISTIIKAQNIFMPVTLKTEFIEKPLGIDNIHPRFSWVIQAAARNTDQSAYEITLGETKEGAISGARWSSGKINSDKTSNIFYSGPSLSSFTRYYWRVRIYDGHGMISGWSEPSWFETGYLSSSDWRAHWIGDGTRNPSSEADYYKPDRMPYFKKTFVAAKKIVEARLYISGLGYYEAYLNGKRVGDHVLDPGFTTVRKEVLYSVYDITGGMQKGNNVVSIMLGNGWWNPLPFKLFGHWDLREYQQTGRPCVRAELHLLYADGKKETIITDENWLTAPGPIFQNNVYLGEKYDARLEQNDWNLPGKEHPAWKNAVLVDGPDGTMMAQMQPPIRITKILSPIKIIQQSNDTFIVDMGQNFAGVARIKVKGKAGDHVVLRYGEDLFPDGSLNYMTTVATQIKKGGIRGGPGAPETAWQQDEYILKGGSEEEWAPRFTFHGFRYVEITGWPGKPSLESIVGLTMNADVPQAGQFTCSNDSLNRLHRAIQWTFLSNLFSVQSDCPGREKMGYGADMVVSSNAFMYNFDMSQFYRKAVRDFANEQRPEGGITEIAPFTGIADRGYGDGSGPLGWELGFPFLQKLVYDFYGDEQLISENYEAVQKQMKFLDSKSVDGLFYWDISDHEALDPKPEALTASAFYLHHAMLASEFARILGKSFDAEAYEKLAGRIRERIVEKFMVPGTGRFDNATQSAQTFALWYRLSPAEADTWKVLKDELKRHDWHLATGIFSTWMLFNILRESDQNELAYRIATQPDYPGWLNMINHHATTLWETWAYPETGPSQNHPMFGSVDEWFYRSLLGINGTAPGFATFDVKPQPVDGLDWAKGSYQSIKGKIVSEWRKDQTGFHLRVVVPANSKARIFIKAERSSVIRESGVKIPNLPYENGYFIFETGSGDYEFTASDS